MRARDFTNFSFDIEPYEGWTGEGVVVHAYDGKDEIGHVIFEPTEDDATQWYAVDVEVEEPYQRIGIATKMYDIAKKAAQAVGAIIVKSHTQTDDGRGLWKDKLVWEDAQPTTAYHITTIENAENILYSGLDPYEGNAFLVVDTGDKKKLRDELSTVANWMYAKTEQTQEPLTLLQVNVTGLPLKYENGWYVSKQQIDPARIKDMGEDELARYA